jgi:hypothetical protein
MKIHLHIERLVIDGVAIDQPRILGKALEQELSGRLIEGGLSSELSAGVALPHMRGGEIEIARGSHSARLGTQIGGAVYRGIGAKK